MNATTDRTLTDDELTPLRRLAEGETVEVIARRLHVSERTVRRKALAGCAHTGGGSTVEAVVWAVRHGLI